MDEKAKQYALRLLSLRSYSSHQLRAKMLKRGFSEEVVSKWIAWLCSVNLLQDDLLLTSLVEREMKRGYGPKAILWKLRNKGFSSEEIARAIPTLEAQKEAIRAWSKKRGKDMRKCASDLIRRGFDVDLVLQELRESF